jgi:hypothetical protein
MTMAFNYALYALSQGKGNFVGVGSMSLRKHIN